MELGDESEMDSLNKDRFSEATLIDLKQLTKESNEYAVALICDGEMITSIEGAEVELPTDEELKVYAVEHDNGDSRIDWNRN